MSARWLTVLIFVNDQSSWLVLLVQKIVVLVFKMGVQVLSVLVLPLGSHVTVIAGWVVLVLIVVNSRVAPGQPSHLS